MNNDILDPMEVRVVHVKSGSSMIETSKRSSLVGGIPERWMSMKLIPNSLPKQKDKGGFHRYLKIAYARAKSRRFVTNGRSHCQQFQEKAVEGEDCS